jgi:hypothetical protein
MPPQSKTDRSTRRLSEVARHVVMPSGIVSSGFAKVEARIHDFGDRFDEWQRGAGTLILGKRANGEYAATVGGVTLSIPRQVSKTYMVSRIVFALCTLFPNMTVLWTAHRTRTTTMTFNSLQGFAKRKQVVPFVAGIRAANGEQEIRFSNGSVIMFGAREQGFGRGFDEVDIEVFDEAQILTEKALEDMVAATNQSRFESGALLFFMGTPPRPVDPGEAFKARRREALAFAGEAFMPVEGEDALYIECSADRNVGRPGGPKVDDVEQIKLANPSYPHRTPHRSVLRLRKNLPSDESWRREALGVWDDDAEGSRRWSADLWGSCKLDATPPDGVRSCGVGFLQDGSRLVLAGAVKHDSGVHVELIDTSENLEGWSFEDGVEALADWFVERKSRVAQVSILGAAGASLRTALAEKKFPQSAVHVMTTPEMFAANSMTENALKERAVTHPGGDEGDVLNASVAVSDAKTRGSGWGWVATTPDGEKEPVEAFCAAYWTARTTKRVPGRKQVLI